MLNAMRTLVYEDGYAAASVTSLITLARVSSKTFYEHFDTAENCFLAAFEESITEIREMVVPAYQRPGSWSERVRAALEALLTFLQAEREIAALVFLEAPKAGAAVRQRRAQILALLRVAIDGGRSQCTTGAMPPALADEVIVEGAVSVIQARLAAPDPDLLSGLANELMGIIAYSYLGAAAAANELERPVALQRPEPASRATRPATSSVLAEIPMRVTYRTLRVMSAIAEHPGSGNREIGAAAGVTDQGQISRQLARLEDLGLIRNDGEKQSWAPKRWRLTPRGEEVERAIRQDLNGGAK